MVNAQAERLFGYERKDMLEAADRDAGARALPRQPSGSARLRSFPARCRAPWAPAAIYTA